MNIIYRSVIMLVINLQIIVYSVWVGVCLAELCGNVTAWWEMNGYCPNSFTLVHSRVCFHRDFCNSSSFTMSAYSVSAHSLWRIADSMNLEIIYLLYQHNLHKCSTTCMYTGENNNTYNSNQNDKLFYRSFWIQHYRSCILYPVSFIANSLLVDFSSCFSSWYSQ